MSTNINVGSAYLTIVPSTDNFIRALRRQLSKSGFDKVGKKLGEDIEKGFRKSRVTQKIQSSFRDMFRGITQLGKYGVLDVLIGTAVTAVSALAPLAGALAGIPAAAVAAGLALGTLALAMGGVGSAFSSALSGDIEGVTSALDDLTSSAKSVVKELVTPFIGLRDIAQESLFAPMVKSAQGFGEVMRGPVQRSITAVATALGEVGAGAIEWLKSSKGAETLEAAAQGAAANIREMGRGLVPLLQGVLDLASALDVQVGAAIGNVATRFGEWLSQIANDGSAERWFANAMTAAGQLWDVLQNVGRTLVAIFSAASSAGGSFDVLVDAADAMADWAESAKGQEALTAIFQFFGTVLREVVAAIGTLVQAFATVAEWFNTLSPGTQNLVAQFIAWSIVLAPLTGRLIALATLLSGVYKAIALLVVGIYRAIAATIPFIASAARVGAAWAVTAARGIATFVAQMAIAFARAIAQFAVMAATAVARAAVVAAAWAVQAAAGIARFVVATTVAVAGAVARFAVLAASAAASAAIVVAGWVMMATQALIQAARMALAWLIALGPVGLIIAAIVAILALVIIFWDEIVAAAQAAGEWLWNIISSAWNAIIEYLTGVWEWIKGILNWDELVSLITDFGSRLWAIWQGLWDLVVEALSAVWDLIVGLVTGNREKVMSSIGRLAELPGKFADWFRGAYNSVKEWLGNALEYVKGIPGRIKDALGDLGSLLVQAGKDLLNGLKEGIMSAWDSIQDTLSDLTSKLPDWKGPASVDRKILIKPAQLVMSGFKKGLEDEFPAVQKLLNDFTSSIGMTTSANISATGPIDARAAGITVENVTVQAADNRFSADELQAQLKMRYA